MSIPAYRVVEVRANGERIVISQLVHRDIAQLVVSLISHGRDPRDIVIESIGDTRGSGEASSTQEAGAGKGRKKRAARTGPRPKRRQLAAGGSRH